MAITAFIRAITEAELADVQKAWDGDCLLHTDAELAALRLFRRCSTVVVHHWDGGKSTLTVIAYGWQITPKHISETEVATALFFLENKKIAENIYLDAEDDDVITSNYKLTELGNTLLTVDMGIAKSRKIRRIWLSITIALILIVLIAFAALS